MKTILMTPDGRTHRYEEGIVLNESANPKHFDSTADSALGKVLAIYEISGDTCKICSGGPGNPRPTQFVGSSDPLTFPRMVTYARGLPPGGMPVAGRSAREKKVSRFPALFRARARARGGEEQRRFVAVRRRQATAREGTNWQRV